MSNDNGGVSAMSAELGSLPEQWDYCYEWVGPFGTRKFSAASHNGIKPTRSVPLFTAEQMRTYAAQQVDAERERCALKPLTESQIDDMLGEANRGFCIERDDYIKAVRDAERSHGIGHNA